MIKIKNFQNELFNFLDNKLIDNFEICLENSIFDNRTNKLYSPFLLSLIGIILCSLNETATVSLLLKKIYKKLLSTPNNEGIYNFYDNNEYFYDVDTTAAVNTFIFNYSQNLPNKDNILQRILGNKNNHDGSILTWFDRSRNNIDWFVNFDVFIFLKVIGYHDEKLIMYLKNNVGTFLENGSRYYTDISFPLFMIFFYYDKSIITEQDFIIPTHIKTDDQLSKEKNILSLGLSYFKNIESKDKKEVLLKLLYDNWAKDVCYFNSSRAFYTSKELNATIALYILNEMEVYK